MESDDDGGDFRRRDKFYNERHGSSSRGYSDSFSGTRIKVERPHGHPDWRNGGPSQHPSRGPPPPPPRGYDHPPPMVRGGEMMPPPDRTPIKRSRSEEREAIRVPPQSLPSPKSIKLEKKIIKRSEKDGYQPAMMTFKAFLDTQDDSISDEEAASKYGEYKLEFKRQQLNEFFVGRKESEWFRLKYHPEESQKRKISLNAAVKKRLDIFQHLIKDTTFENIKVSEDDTYNLINILDSVVIKLEGGTDVDIRDLIQSTINKADTEEVDNTENKMQLHKTSSIFVKSLPSTTTRNELVTICQKYPSFLRVCISDPDPTKKWIRKGWVTFKRNAKIKEICYSINSQKIKDQELSPVVNKDLSRRIRNVTQVANDSRVVRNDIKLASRIIRNLDLKRGLWIGIGGNQDNLLSNKTSNPFLLNIQDFLVEEASAEEDELLGRNSNEEIKDDIEESIETDEKLLKVLDKLILYLRIVHSVDYYNCIDYPFEDEMPNRCGILHARAVLKESDKVSPLAIQEYIKNVETKLGPLVESREILKDEEAIKLGMKDEKDEVEKFVLANCQEIAKDKWLCPISGKKFKGPDFIRKHIFNKYMEKVEEVKQETSFFNNYLKDPRRPELPTKPVPKPAKKVPKENDEIENNEMPPNDFGDPSSYTPPRKRSIHERLGARYPIAGGIRVTHSSHDPRNIVDYSDIDLGGPPDYF